MIRRMCLASSLLAALSLMLLIMLEQSKQPDTRSNGRW